MKYYIVVGEASGDLHGSNLMKGLYAKDPQADIRFWGGELMDEVFHTHQQGIGLVQDYKDGAIIGFVQIAMHLNAFLKKGGRCAKDILDWKPDVVILIDYPGFNFRIAEFAHKRGIRTFYYIAPKVWASREWRIRKLRKYVDKLFIVFPFEIPYFKKKGVDFMYKGNPLVDAIANSSALKESRGEFLIRNELPDRPIIALLAGSRKGEINSMMPVFMSFADKMRELPRYKDYQFIIAGAPSRSISDYEPFIGDRDSYVHIIFGQSQSIVRNAQAAVVNSGTASLETALLGTPQVVAYKGSVLNFQIAKMIIKVKFISLGNLILDRTCFRELLQYYFNADNILDEIIRILEDDAYRDKMLRGYEEIKEKLGGKGASDAVAESMINELSLRKKDS